MSVEQDVPNLTLLPNNTEPIPKLTIRRHSNGEYSGRKKEEKKNNDHGIPKEKGKEINS